jgi:hypothetical protein
MAEYIPGVYVVEKRIIISGERLKPRDIGEVVADRGAAKPKRIHHKPRIRTQPPLEKRVKHKIEQPRQGKQPVLFLEEKDRSGRGYSTTYDIKGVPIIKLRYSKNEPKYPPTDGREQRIASLEIISGGSTSFISFDKGSFVQGNFELTEPGYASVKDFLLTRPSRASRRRRGRRGRSKDIVGELSNSVNYFLKDNRRVLIIQTAIDQLQLDALEWVEQKKIGRGVTRTKSLKPKNTTQEFNSYVYDALVRTYARFAKPFLGQKK